MASCESAPQVWRHHHNGGLQFQARVEEQDTPPWPSSTLEEGKRYWLRLPWMGKRIEITADQEEMRGRLRAVAINEVTVDRLMAWLFGVAAEAPVSLAKLVESLV